MVRHHSANSVTKDNSRRDQLIMEHLSLVTAIAVRVHENLPVHVELDDLIHAGVMGLFDSATKYNATKEVAFPSYAKHRIKGAILDNLRELDWASRDLRRRHKQIEAVTRELTNILNRAPSEAEIAEKMGISMARWRKIMIDLRNVGLAAAQSRVTEREDMPALECPGSKDQHPDEICARTEMRTVLGKVMKGLPPRHQQVVTLYYERDLTMKEIGDVLGVNESRVSQIHKAALEKMQTTLVASGISSSVSF